MLKNMTVGKNLRRIRKELDLKQSQIVGKEITRNLISMIEHDRSPMSYRVAQIVSENINRVCRERGKEIYVAPEDIMYPERVEAKGEANKYIDKLKKHISTKKYEIDTSYVEKIIKFLNKWKMTDKKVEVYEALGELSHLKGDLEWEYLYLNKALENYFVNPVKIDIHIIVIKLIENCVSNGKYHEALTLMRLDIMKKDDIPKKDKSVIYYNEALIHKKMGDHDKTLDLLNKYEEFFQVNNDKVYRRSLVLRAICYEIMQEIEKAIVTYKLIIYSFDCDVEEVALAYSNIGTLLIKASSLEEIIRYKDEVLKLLSYLEKINSKYLIDVYASLGETHEYLTKVDLAEYYYICAINKAIDRKESGKSAKLLIKLLNLYNITNQKDKILLSNSIFKRGFQNIKLSNEMKLAFSLVLTNMRLGEEKIASDIVSDILKGANGNED